MSKNKKLNKIFLKLQQKQFKEEKNKKKEIQQLSTSLNESIIKQNDEINKKFNGNKFFKIEKLQSKKKVILIIYLERRKTEEFQKITQNYQNSFIINERNDQLNILKEKNMQSKIQNKLAKKRSYSFFSDKSEIFSTSVFKRPLNNISNHNINLYEFKTDKSNFVSGLKIVPQNMNLSIYSKFNNFKKKL